MNLNRPTSQLDIFLNTTPTDFSQLDARLSVLKTNPGQTKVFLLALLARGFDLNNPFPDSSGMSLVEHSLIHRSLHLLPILNELNIDINKISGSDVSTFERLLNYNEVDSVEYFIVSGKVDVNHSLSSGDFPVHIAAKNNSFAMLKVLSEHGADFNQSNHERKVARSYFSFTKNEEHDLFENISRKGVQNFLNKKVKATSLRPFNGRF